MRPQRSPFDCNSLIFKPVLRRRNALSALLVMLLLSISVLAQAAVDPELLAGMKARAVGPAGMSGRVAAVAAVPGQPNTIYAGAASGGVWKSVDGGLSFEPIFDDQPVHAIGAIAIAPSNPQTVWVGTGEGNVRNSVSIGNGVYRSLDGGRTWKHMGLAGSERIHRIIVHPQNADIVYVTAMGQLWGENAERGVFRTRDGGETWEKILYVNERTGASDLTMDPVNPNKLFASTWEYRRWPYSFKSGGEGSGLWRTVDGGDTWTRLTEQDGLPAGELGRIGVAIAPSDPDVVYALVEANKSAFLRSNDGGYTFTTTNTDPNVAERPFYYNSVYVNPQDADKVYRTASIARLSSDGGRTFQPWIGWDDAHPDHHALWFDPTNGDYAITGNDGGVSITYDGGDNWRHVRNLPIAQFYHVRVDNDVPYHIYGGLQDNGSWRGPSATWENGGIRNSHWLEVAFGDGFDTIPDPDNSRQGYAMSQQGFLSRWDLDTSEDKIIRPPPPDADTDLRFNWNAAFAQDPFDSATIYYGSQFVHRSTNRGDDWAIISPDLTSNNAEWQKQGESGGITPDVTGAENYTTIIAIAPSPLERGVIWVGTDDGYVHITRDGGGEWERLDRKARGVPENTWVPQITPSMHEAGTAFVVFDNHHRSDFAAYVYRVENYGQRWTRLDSEGVTGYALSIVQDTVDPDLLFLGTELGLFVSLNAGENWFRWTHGIPKSVSVMDLALQTREHDLVLGTHGRSFLVLDDIRPLRQLNDLDPATPLQLLSAPPAQQHYVQQSRGPRFPGATEYRGEDDAYGATITWYMSGDDLPHPDADKERQRLAARKAAKADASADKDEDKDTKKAKSPGDKVIAEIRDHDGQLVRHLEVKAYQGVNRMTWDLNREAFPHPNPQPSPFGPQGGPEVAPGKYELTLKWGDHSVQSTIEVLPDPRIRFDADAITARESAIERARAAQAAVTASVRNIASLKADFKRVKDLAQQNIDRRLEQDPTLEIDDEDAYKALIKAIGDSKKALSDSESKLWPPQDAKGITARTTILQQIGLGIWFNTSNFAAPTDAQLGYLAVAEVRTESAIAENNDVVMTQYQTIKDQAAELGLDVIVPVEAVEYQATSAARNYFGSEL